MLVQRSKEACGFMSFDVLCISAWPLENHTFETFEIFQSVQLTFSGLLNGCSGCKNEKTWSCWRNEMSVQPTRVNIWLYLFTYTHILMFSDMHLFFCRMICIHLFLCIYFYKYIFIRLLEKYIDIFWYIYILTNLSLYLHIYLKLYTFIYTF